MAAGVQISEMVQRKNFNRSSAVCSAPYRQMASSVKVTCPPWSKGTMTAMRANQMSSPMTLPKKPM